MNILEARRRILGGEVVKKTAEGNPISVRSLVRRYPGITMQGWTEQAQYEGKNLLPINIGQIKTGSSNENNYASFETDGVRVHFEPGYEDLYFFGSGTLTPEESYVEIPQITPGEYYISNNDNSMQFYVVVWRNNQSVILGFAENNNTKIVVEDGDKFRVFLRRNADTTIDKTINPMIVKDGDDTTIYEPYTGGQPSPNPDYPQEIVSAGKRNEAAQKWEYEIEVGCGQLLNFQENNVTLSGITCESKIDTITINGTKTNGDGGRLLYKTNDFVLQPGTYTFSHEVVNDINSTISGSFLTKKDSNEILGITFTLNESTEVYIGTNIYEARQANDVVVRCMLNTGSTPLPYTPYRTPQSALLTTTRPLTKWDKLEKRNGQWGWVYKSAEIMLDGSEGTWGEYGGYSGFYSNVLPFTDERREGLSDSLAVLETFNVPNNVQLSAWLGVSNSYIYILNVPQYDVNLPDRGKQNWRDWLSENPITILTYLDKETFVPLSTSEQEQMNELYTFRPTTVLSNDAGCEMSLTYKTKKSLEVTT